MIEKAIKGVVEQGVRALEYQAEGCRNSALQAAEIAEKHKRLVAELVNLSAEVRESGFFQKLDALHVGEVTCIGPLRLDAVGVQFGHGGYHSLNGFPAQGTLPQGRYRIVLMLQKVGDL